MRCQLSKIKFTWEQLSFFSPQMVDLEEYKVRENKQTLYFSFLVWDLNIVGGVFLGPAKANLPQYHYTFVSLILSKA